MSDYDYLNEFIDRADGKVPEGNHHLIAAKVEDPKTWDDGGVTVRVQFTAPAYNNQTVDCVSLPPKLPTKDEVAAAEKSMPSDRYKAYMMGVRTLKTLADNYGISEPSRITIGTEFDAKVIITKVKQNPITGAKKGGWPKVVAFLPKGSVEAKVSPASDIPY